MQKPQIMIVEDEGLVALGIKEGLENMGYEVPAIAEAGEEALLLVRDSVPDLILMDIRLKGQMDGIEAAEIIRKKYFVPVIFLTAHSDESTLQRAKISESYGYIIKPFDEKTLRAAIEIALYKAQGEKKLKDSNDWYSMVFRSIGEGVIITDRSGVIKFINMTASIMLDKSEDACEGNHYRDIFEVRDAKTRFPIEIDVSKFLLDGTIIENPDSLITVHGNGELPIELTLAPLINSNNMALGIIILLKTKKPMDKREEAARRELLKPIEIQQSLLPENGKVIQGVKIRWLFLPSRFGSGDLFNFLRLDEEHIGFYILDVMGHGFQAAIFAITLHNMLLPYPHGGFLLARPAQSSVPIRSSFLPLSISPPAQVIADLNKRFSFETNTSPFFTIVYGIINTRTKRATLARAGHMPPVLQKSSGEIIRYKMEGSAIGLFPELWVEEKVIELEKGDRLLFHTDGLIDSRNHEMNEYSFDRLKTIIDENAGKNIDNLIFNLKESIVEWKDEEVFDDDIAFCVLTLEDD